MRLSERLLRGRPKASFDDALSLLSFPSFEEAAFPG